MADRSAFLGHDGHDLELVAAVAADDAAGADARRGAVQIAECAACAAIAVDLRAVMTATQALGSVFDGSQPAAPRDFRLTPAVAERLARRPGLRLMNVGRVRAWARGLGTGFVAVGLAALVVSAGQLNLLGGGGAATFGSKAEQRDTTITSTAPSRAGGTTTNLGAQATDAPPPAADVASTHAPADEGSIVLLLVGGLAIVLGFGLLVAARAGARAGP